MPNPYEDLEDMYFWKKAVAEKSADSIFPVQSKAFRLNPADKVVTAGSCFAQNVGKYLRQDPTVTLLETEALAAEDPVFSGRYGNIYTARQLNELFEESESGVADPACAIQRHDGRYVDAFRPFMAPQGFASAEEVRAARQAHILAIRPIFHSASVFVFTLGLTEAWCALGPQGEEQRVYPVCPGIYSDDAGHTYAFKNFSFAEILADMQYFITRLTAVNPTVKVLLTVSPVPLTATYSQDHILSATMASKSILRTVCGELVSQIANVFYFPSYEMVANPYTAQSAYAENLRTVRPEVIQSIMGFFRAAYIAQPGQTEAGPPDAAPSDRPTAAPPAVAPTQTYSEDLICDDIQIEKSVGF